MSTTAIDGDVALTPADLAKRLRVSEKTLRQMVRDHTVPAPVRLGPRVLRWSAETIREFLASGGTDGK